ncbi:MAG TPA: hypothetical protein VGK87_10550 [Anaerolineae bacterium]
MKGVRRAFWSTAVILLVTLGQMGFTLSTPANTLALAGLAAPLSAVTIVTEAGFNGYIKPGGWIPVLVTLTSSEPIEGDITLSPLPDRSQRYGVHLSLARNTKKQLLLYTPVSNGPIEALFSNAGVVVGEATLSYHALSDDDRLVLVVSDPSDGFNFLNDLHTPYGGMTYVAQVQPVWIPDYTAALNSVDTIVFNNVDTLTLSEAQRNAIRAWVLGGGHLILSGGPGARLTLGGFEDFAPAHVGQTLQNGSVERLRDLLAPNNVEASANVSASLAITPTSLRPGDLVAPLVTLLPATSDAHSMVSSNDTTLIMRREIGHGVVDQLAFDATLSPIHDWDDLRYIFSAILGGVVSLPNSVGAMREPSGAVNAARALPGAALPPFLIIFGFLALYVVAIGPLNFYLLRRMNRLSWAWVTIPGTVILFAIGGYATGFRLHGNEPQVHRLSIIMGDAQVTGARSQAIVGVFSPRRVMLDVATGHSLAQEVQPNPNQPDKVSFFLSNPNRLEKIAAVNSDVRAFYLQGESLLPHIEADLDFIPGRTISDVSQIRGEIRNVSSASLNDCVLIAGKDFHAVGDIAPNARLQASVKMFLGKPQMGLVLPPSRVVATGYVSSLGMTAGHGSSSSTTPTFSRLPFDMDGASLAQITLNWRDYGDNRLAEQAERGLVTAIFNYPSASAGSGVSLACWESNDRAGAQVADASYTDRGLRIWRLPVHSYLAAPQSTLPADAFIWNVTSSSSAVSLDQNGLTMQPGEHIVAMSPWMNVRASGNATVILDFAATTNGTSAALRNSNVSLYDWSAQKFTQVITSTAVPASGLRISGAYVSPTGEIRLRVNVRDDDILMTAVQTGVIFAP